jgi:hypothetical protein
MIDDLAVELAALDTRRRVIDALAFGDHDDVDAAWWLCLHRYLAEQERQALGLERLH